ncbi:MAG: hypothetical protein R3E89_14995 [Thiolinea sp.]
MATVFGIAVDPNLTLVQALALKGGGINALLRHATAALLNAASDVEYPYTQAEIIGWVQAAVESGSAQEIETLKNTLAAANELGCPLN